VASAISVPIWKLLAIIEGGEQMTADLDLLLTKYFGMSEGFFTRWQDSYNARIAKRRLQKKLAEIIPISNFGKVAAL
jgi:plasmid maintenance system antidote protein VapI